MKRTLDREELESVITLIEENNQYNDDSITIKFWHKIAQKLRLQRGVDFEESE